MTHIYAKGATIYWRAKKGDGPTCRAVVVEQIEKNDAPAYVVSDNGEDKEDKIIIPESWTITEMQAFNESMVQGYGKDRRKK